jgi:hypothetical protein
MGRGKYLLGQVQKQGGTLHGTTFLEIGTEETEQFPY